MKKVISMCWLVLWLTAGAQSEIPVTTGKTMSLVFPRTVKYVDRGSKELLVQLVKEVDNVVLVKAATAVFPETNLSVITEDGAVYSFRVFYQAQPTVWVYQIPPLKSRSVQTYAYGILDNKAIAKHIRNRSGNVAVEVCGIYVKEGTMYFQLRFFNRSALDYDIDQIIFSVKDKRKTKRTAVQEMFLQPVQVVGNSKQIRAHGNSTLVCAFDKMTIPGGKYFWIRIREKNGGRQLHISLKNHQLMNAQRLPDLN